ncbi:transposase [Nonomuraea sp. B5E05]|uniref:transposase n=1 Tax=Nonomuraea sp. B5E05 TaxID=3153569 RepID=UPI0032615339
MVVLLPAGHPATARQGVHRVLRPRQGRTHAGQHLSNPRHLAASAGRLADAQRALARKKRGSKRRRKAVARVATLHAKVRRQRLDGAHKAALALARAYDVIVHEDLRIVRRAGMQRTPT